MKEISAAILLIATMGFAPISLVHADNTLNELPEWDIQAQGGFLMRHQFSAPVAAEVVDITVPPSGASFGPERIEASDNYTGGINVRRRLNEKVDLGLGYSGIASAGNNQNYSSPSPATTLLFIPALITNPMVGTPGGLNVSARTTATHHIADLDLGYLLTLSSVSTLKVIGGVRFVQFEQKK